MKLANLLEQHPCLWDRSSDDYKNRTMRFDAVKKIADELGVNQMEADLKYRVIIGQFQRELRKENAIKLGARFSRRSTSKWFLMKHLRFLSNMTEVRATIDSFEPLESLIQVETVPSETNPDEINEEEFVSRDEEQENLSSDHDFRTPEPVNSSCKTCKKRKIEDMELSEAGLSLANSLSAPPADSKKTKDEMDLFGALVSQKMKSLKNPIVRLQAEQEINSILFQKQAEDAGYLIIPTKVSSDKNVLSN